MFGGALYLHMLIFTHVNTSLKTKEKPLIYLSNSYV